MPDFYVGDLDISPDEFVAACSDRELNELLDILMDEGIIKENYLTNNTNDNILDEIFNEALQKIAISRHRLTSEEEEIIKVIASRL
jgi:hypothetical protein